MKNLYLKSRGIIIFTKKQKKYLNYLYFYICSINIIFFWKNNAKIKGGVSMAGKEVLIKSVAQACPTYIMSVFKLPNYVCEDLTSLVSNFQWSSKEKSKGVSWVSWRKMCNSKKNGGLGLRDLKCFNLALLASGDGELLCILHH